MASNAEELRSITELKEEMKQARKSLDENQKVKDEIAKEQHAIRLARINRRHAKQEIERYEKQKKELNQILSQYDQSSEVYKAAQMQIQECQQFQDTCVEQIKECTQEIQKGQQTIEKYNDIINQFTAQAQAILDADRKELNQQRVEEAKDFLVSIPGDTKKMAEELADNATATLSELTDAMDTAIHDTKDKGLVAFDHLSQTVPSIMRAYNDRQIQLYEKDLAKAEKFVKFVDKFEEITTKKKEQVKEVGRGLKALFTDWGNKPKDQAKPDAEAGDNKEPKDKEEMIEQIANQSKHKKPGFLRWVANTMVKYDASKLEKLYQAQIQSYKKTIDRNIVKQDEVIGNQYKRMEDRIKDVNTRNQNEIDDLTVKQDELKVKRDELVK